MLFVVTKNSSSKETVEAVIILKENNQIEIYSWAYRCVYQVYTAHIAHLENLVSAYKNATLVYTD